MISWIQRTFQHHFRTVFAILLAVTIISFIATIGATPGIGRGDRRDIRRDFFGHNLASQEDMGHVMGDASLSIELQAGYSGIDPERVKMYALQRVAALHIADEWHVPSATTEEVTTYIKSLGIFQGQDGQFDATRYASFRQNVKTSGSGTGEADIARVLGDDVRMKKVERLLNGPGYVLDSDVKSELQRAETSWSLATATIDYASYKPTLSASEAELNKYFKDNSFRYQIPTRIVAESIDFPAQNYVSSVTASDTEVRAFYDQNRERFPAPQAAKTAKVSANADADFVLVKSDVKEALISQRAKQAAAKAASDLAYALYEGKVSSGTNFNQFISARKLSTRSLAPFTAEDGPSELGNSADMTDAVSKLDLNRFFSEAVTTANGASILVYKSSIPSTQPTLLEVHDKVKNDFADSSRHRSFSQLGSTLRGVIQGRLDTGMAFEKAVSDASKTYSVTIKTGFIPTFTLRDRPKTLTAQVGGTLDRLEKGQISDMVIDADSGILVYAADKKAPTLNASNPQVEIMRQAIGSSMARLASSSYLGELVNKELKRTEEVVKK
jgi:peptidyl-prolyl cis-trans isomerase D